METLKLTLPIAIQDIIKLWARQAGSFDKTVPPETQEIKYMNAMMEMFGMLAKHHDELDDSNFIRAFRFFRDTGFAKRLHGDTSMAKRASKLEGIEPDMLPPPKEPEPVKSAPTEPVKEPRFSSEDEIKTAFKQQDSTTEMKIPV